MEVRPRTIYHYTTQEGRDLFQEWYSRLKDLEVRVAIQARLARVRQGLFGDWKPVGDGVYELRIFIGPGYRIYIGFFERSAVLLLCGGDKGRQSHDIRMAQRNWNDFLTRRKQ